MDDTALTPRRAGRVLVALGLSAFVVFGMRDGAIGVAWPSIRAAFGQPLSALGVLLSVGLGGYLLASVASGRLLAAVPAGRQLLAASGCAIVGVLSFALSTHWWTLIAGSCLLGSANGIVDVNVNAYIAVRHGVGTANLVHAGWGIGTTLGPAAVTASLVFSGSWRSAYLVLVGLELLILGGFVKTRRLWDSGIVRLPAERPGLVAAAQPTGVLLTLALFFTYAGLELATGQWAFTSLVSGHGVSTTVAGLAVAGYWAALTAGRLAASMLGPHVSAASLLDTCLAVSALGCLLIATYPGLGLAVAGLAITGVGLGPIFPTLVSTTPRRVGPARTAAMMSYQLAAAAIGGTALSAGVGLALQHFGPAALGAILVLGVAVVVAVRAAAGLERTSPRTVSGLG